MVNRKMLPFKINLHEHEEYISSYIRTYGWWEPITTEILTELFNACDPNTIFVDIGANIGYFSLLAASRGIQTVAFEPVTANYSLMEKSIADNGYEKYIQSYRVPLSDKQEKITINVSSYNMGLCSTTRELHQDNFSYSETMIAEPLDSYFGASTQNNLIVKIDVELHEKKVLRGMEQTLTSGKVSHIILEISEYDSEIFDLLRTHGFQYCIDLGFSDRSHINPDTQYLKTKKYLGIVDTIIDYFQNTDKEELKKTGKSIQKMLLLYKTPSPV